MIRGVRKIVQLLFALLFKTRCPLKVNGREHLPETEPFILCANQSSHLDVFALIAASQYSINECVVLLAADHLHGSLCNRLKRILLPFVIDYFPIHRVNNASIDWRRFTASLSSYLLTSQKKVLIVFPDGTRTKTGGMNPFKPGVSFLAHRLALPVVPALIEGTYECLPHQSYFPRQGVIEITFGYPAVFLQTMMNAMGHFAAYEAFAKTLFHHVEILRSQ